MAEATGEAKARVFFALWPDDAVRRRLHEEGMRLHAQLGGRLTRAPSIHMTLLFLGDVVERRLSELAAAAGNVPFRGFSMNLDIARCWRHNRIAWVGPRETPSALGELVAALQAALDDAGIGFDRKPFAAHVTLVRDARCAESEYVLEPVTWTADGFVLVRSTPGGGASAYRVIGRWPRREEA